MDATIRLTKFKSEDEALPTAQRQAWPVSILAEGQNVDDHIFVYHVGKPDDPIPGDRFECVASVNQMYEIPKNQGISLTTQTAIPYYRSNVLEYVARSASEAEDIWLKVVEEVEWFLKNWNSATKMKATKFADISVGLTTITDPGMNPPIRIQLSYHPAGKFIIDAQDRPTVNPVDRTQVGWLPVSELGGYGVPPGARLYYNIARDGGLSAVWPPKQPFDGNQLHLNGILLPYGQVWMLTEQTVWWMNFTPGAIAGYVRDALNYDWEVPWPPDYVNRENPGAIPNNLTLTLFK